jgi:hypothetical protein
MTDVARGKALRQERLRLEAEGDLMPDEIDQALMQFRKDTNMVSQTGHAPQRAKHERPSTYISGHIHTDRRKFAFRDGKAVEMTGVGAFKRPNLR